MPHFDHAFDWARRNVEAGPLPTAVLGIATSAGVAALDAFGVERGRAASVDDHYPLFSVTKPIVGLAALRLIEAGRLTPETPLDRAIPEFGAGRDDVVRLRHLVSHTSGIIESPMDTPGLRRSLLAPGRDFAAGSVSRYSTIAFEGVAALIEHASGAPWDRAIDAVGERAGATASRSTPRRAGTRSSMPPSRASTTGGSRRCGIPAPDSSAAPKTCSRSAAPCCATTARSSLRSRMRRCSGRSPQACRSSSRTREPRPGLGLHVEPAALGAGLLAATRTATAAGPARVLDHAVARRLLRAADERRRRLRPLRRRGRPAAQRGGRATEARHAASVMAPLRRRHVRRSACSGQPVSSLRRLGRISPYTTALVLPLLRPPGPVHSDVPGRVCAGAHPGERADRRSPATTSARLAVSSVAEDAYARLVRP